MKKATDRLLSMVLVFVMMLSMLPAMSMPVLAADEGTSTDTGTKDALGISMAEWTDEERAAAEANLPFGTGYGTWTTLMEISELYFSMGYDRNTRLTGLFDWNSDANGKSLENVADSTIKDKIDKFKQDDLKNKVSVGYKAVATAAMDLKGSGKKEYVANLALSADGKSLKLYVTDSKNNTIGNSVTFNNVNHLGSFEVHQVNGLFAVTAGDFDGDGVDTVVVYVPQTDSDKKTSGSYAPFIREYAVTSSGVWTEKSTVHADVLGMLGNNGIDKLDNTKNSPMVALLAEDVDKDGFDELIVTGNMNDVTSQDTQLGTKVFIYDKKADNSWNQSYYRDDKVYGEGREIQITDYGNRMVWGSTSVGNIINSTDTSKLDYPEIVTAGFIDNEKSKQQHINVDNSDPIGVSVLQAQEVIDKTNQFTVSYTTTEDDETVTKTMTSVNVICSYKEVLNQKLDSNGWTKGGLFEDEDVNSLLQVQVYAAKGLGEAESVFISGSVYRINSDGKLEEEYKHNSFKSKDSGAGSGTDGRSITNTMVAAVTAGNFNGNADGREQLIFVTCLKESGKNNAFSRVYCYYYDKDKGEYVGEDSGYLTQHKGHFYVTLATLDTDNDSIIAKLESVDRDYSSPTVMAILEAVPYFAETQEKGEGETVYGLSSSKGEGSSDSFGYTLGSSVGYEFESTVTQSGGGFSLAIDRAYNWDTEHTETVTYEQEMSNVEGDNLVYVSRYPIVTYTYRDTNGKKLVVEKVGQPASSMITVEDYNEAAEAYGLQLITRESTGISTAGDPYSYVRTAEELKAAEMTEIVQFQGVGQNASSTDTTGGWQQYSSSGVIKQGMTVDKTKQKTFNYDLDISLTVFAKVGGVTASGSAGFTYGYSKTSIDGSSVTKSGAVNGAKFDGYDFQWKFAAWNCKLNGDTVPVLGYFLKDVVSPPSPPEGITAESVTTDSITLRWASGTRSATQYRIYRVGDTSATDYVLVGAVSGDETSYTLTGLKPGETYTYVIRGVAFEDDGDAVESVDSAPVTVRTQSEGSTVALKLYGVTNDNVLESTGKTASLSVEVSGTNGGAVSYQWQALEAGTAGVKTGWVNANKLDGDGIGTVSGATASTLTLKTIDKSMNGSYLRCVVSVVSRAGDVETYYSPIVTLDLSGLPTTTTISLTGTDVTGSGSITDPYAGMSNYEQISAKIQTDYVITALSAADAGKVYDIYAYGDTNTVYVAVNGDDYYAANVTVEDDPPYPETKVTSIGDKLTVKPADYCYSVGEDTVEYTVPDGFDGDTTVSETAGGKTYFEVYMVSDDTVAAYWLNTTDGKYYTKTEGAFTEAASQPSADADLRSVYYEDDSILILDAAALTGKDDEGNEIILVSEYDRYAVYKKSANGSAILDQTIWRKQDTGLYRGDSLYADFTELNTVYNWKEENTTVTTIEAKPGTEITLASAVKDSLGSTVNTTVVFTITNTTTGVATTLTTASGADVTWTASDYGLYRIVATALSTTGAKSSTSECYYLADDNATDYRLALMQGSMQVTSLTYDGDSVKPVLEKKTGEAWTTVASGVTYLANNVAFTGDTYTPDTAGSYVFSALVDGKTVATSVLTVNKKAITVTPVWDTTDGATNTIPAFSDIKLLVTDAQGNTLDNGVLNGAMKISCGLYDDNGNIKNNSASGIYTVRPVYVSDKKEQFLSRYDVTVNTADIFYSGGALTVYITSGENGTVYARYVDPSGTEFAFDSGSQISMDYGLKFVAEPKEGWSVDKWTVTVPDKNGKTWDITDNENFRTCYGNTWELNAYGMSRLKAQMENNGYFYKKELDVSVTFTNRTHEITYSAGNGGTLTATAGGSALSSGTSVANNASVTFTAAPAEGYMVDKWTVNGAEYKWDSGDLYREKTLTLDNISANTNVTVSFVAAQSTTFYVSAVDENGRIPTGASILVADAQGNEFTTGSDGSYTVPYDSSVTFTAQLSNAQISVVKEWQTSTNGENWTTVPGSGSQNAITLSTHDNERLYVRAVIVSAQTYTVNWSIALEGGGNVTDAMATLGASSNGVGLANNQAITIGMPVDFALTIVDDAYELVGWSENVVANGNNARIESLTENTIATATIRKKPVVTYAAGEHGTISVPGGANGSITVSTGDSVTFTAGPADKYVVKCWKVDGVAVAASQTEYTLTNVSTDCEVTVEFELANPMKVDYTAGSNGTLTAKGDGSVLTTGAVVPGDSKLEFTAEPAEGCMVKCWKINGTEVTRENMAQLGVTMGHYLAESLTFNSPNRDVKVDVEFAEYVAYDIPTAGSDAGYTITVISRAPDVYRITDNTKIRENGDVTFTVVPEDGKKISEITCTNAGADAEVTSNSDGSYTVTVTNVTGAIELDVTVSSGNSSGGSSSGGSGGGSIGGGAVSGGDVTEPNVAIKDNANGTVTADTDSAKKGDTVTVTVTPDSGYTLETLTVLDKNGKEIELTNQGNGKYSFVMPAGKVEIVATFMDDNTLLNFFVDVSKDDYFYEAVLWAVENGITSGVGDSLFAPDLSCTRAQIVTFLWNAAGSPEPISKNNPFTDVKESDYFYKAVLWAVENGITSGTGANTFSPDATCTRAQAAVFLYHYEQNNGGGFTGAWMFRMPFTDVPEWCHEAVAWCYKEEITSGTSATTFGTDEDCTRAQIVTFLYRFLHE